MFAVDRRMEPSRVRGICWKIWMIEAGSEFQRFRPDDVMTDEGSRLHRPTNRFVNRLPSAMASEMRNRFENEGLLEKLACDRVCSLLMRLKMTCEHGIG